MSMEFFNDTRNVARKPHKCEACGRTIEAGELYRRQSGKWEGDFFTRAWCCDCEAIMEYYFEHIAMESEFDYWEVQDEIADRFCHACPHGGNGDDDCEEKAVWHCQRVLNAIREVGGGGAGNSAV